MKKVLCLCISILIIILVSGCQKEDEKDIIKDFDKMVNKLKSYKINGTLKLVNNEESYMYDVEVSYESKNKFKVDLTNKTNNHKQIILRNSDGVYVITPSLNKSFKFESEWPYNNSQIYILQTLANDLKTDKKYDFKKTKKYNIFKTTVNYPNNNALIKQKIYLDKNNNLKKVEVINRDNQVQMLMKFEQIDTGVNFDKNYFDLNENMKVSKTKEKVKTVSKIEDNIYPMYLPKNTHLEKEDKVSKENGERVIMTFSGDNPFMIIKETVNVEDNYEILPVSGDPTLISGSIAAMAENELTWIDNGVEYYIVSSKLKDSDLANVASSISVASVINQK